MEDFLTCSSCGNKAPVGHRFCGHCGAPLPKPAAPPASSLAPAAAPARRPISALFADLTNYTSASIRSEPEKIYLMLRQCLRTLAECVQEYGGRVDRFMGDGVLAKFGIPEAHEDDPERAVRTALAMQGAMVKIREQFRSSSEWEMHLRVGIDAGSVIVGQLGGVGGTDSSIYGQAVNTASRLQEAARPDTVLVSEAVFRLTHARFEFSSPITLRLRGDKEPILAYEVIAIRQKPQRTRGLAGRTAPMVGRESEARSLVDRFQRMAVGQRGAAFAIFGDAGVGKSRLVEETLHAVGPGVAVFRAEANPLSKTAYGLLTHLMEGYFQIEPGLSPEARREKILQPGHWPPGALSDSARAMNALLGGAELAGEWPDAQHGLDPQGRGQAVRVAVRRLLTWRSRSQPIVVVCEDIHWADRASLEALAHLMDLVDEVPLVLLFTSRSDARPELSTLWANQLPLGREQFQEILIKELTREQSELLVDLLLGEASLPVEIKRAIADRSAGNPFLLEEIIRMLLDRGVLRPAADQWEIQPGWEAAIQRVPDTVVGLILSRADRLPAELRRLLQAAAVLGRSFTVDLLAAVVKLDPDLTLRQLETLENLDFVRRMPGHPGDRYAFRHALTQQAVYDTLLQSTRKDIHLRAAEELERRAGYLLDEDTALLALHYAQSDSERAVPYLLAAAHRAQARFANDDALHLYQQAEHFLAGAHTSAGLRAEVALAVGDVLAQMGQAPEAEARYRSALEQAQAAHRDSMVGLIHFKLAKLANDRGDFTAGLEHLTFSEAHLSRLGGHVGDYTASDVARERGWAHFALGHLQEAEDLTWDAIELAEADDDRPALASAFNLLAGVLYRQGTLGEAVAYAERALELREQMGDTREAAIIQSNLGALYVELGEWRRAEQLQRQALFVFRELGDPVRAGRAWSNLAFLLMNQGRINDALHCLDQALALAVQQSYVPGIIARRISRGRLWLKAKEPSRAVPELELAVRAMLQSGQTVQEREAKALLAEAHLRLENLALARKLADECLQATPPDDSGEIAAAVYLAAGEVCAAQGQSTEALAFLEKARNLLNASGNRYEQAVVDQRLGDLILSMAETGSGPGLERGLEYLAEALKSFRALGASQDAREVEDRLKQVPRLQRLANESDGSKRNRMALVMHVVLQAGGQDGNWSDLDEAGHALRSRAVLALRGVAEESRGAAVSTRRGLALVYQAKDVVAALRAALTVQDAVLYLNQSTTAGPNAHSLRVKIGIAAGTVPEGEGQDLLMEDDLVANVAQVGRRAQALADFAEAATVLVSQEVYGLGGDQFVFEEVADHAGARVPFLIYRLRRARAASLPPRPLPSSATRLVGRTREMALLNALVQRMARGQAGEVAYLEGEAGTGKTRVVQELSAALKEQAIILHGKCETYRSGMSYWPFLDMLQTPEGQQLDAESELRMLLGLRSPDRDRRPLVQALRPEQARSELFARFRAKLIEVARRRPLLLILEDVHWVDLASLDLLEFLIPLTATQPIGFLLVGRAELAGVHRALIGFCERTCRDRFLRLNLSDLSPEDSVALVTSILGVPELPPSLSWIHRTAGNNPLLLEETLRLMVERGWLGWDAGPEVGSGGEATPLVPETFREVMLARLDSLEQDSQHLVQVAAVIGETFDKSVLRWVARLEDLAERLTELVEREILLPADGANPLVYRFKHTLTRETIYSTLLASKRTLLHQRVGEALEALFPDRQEEYAELLSYHYENSGVGDKAIDYLILAGQKSADRYARDEALSYFRRGLSLLMRTNPMAIRQRFAVVVGLADALASFGSHSEAVEHLRDLLSLGEGGGLSSLQQAAAYRRLGRSCSALGDYSQATSALQRARILVAGSPELEPAETAAQLPIEQVKERVQCEHGYAQVLLDTRHYDEARRLAEWALALARRAGLSADAADILSVLGALAYRRGELPSAMEAVHASLAIRSELGDRAGAAAAHSNLGVLAVSMLEWTSAEEDFRLSLDLRRAIGDLPGVVIANNNLGQLLKDRGRMAEALAVLEEAVEVGGRVEARSHVAQAWINLGEARALAGHAELAWAAFDYAQRIAEDLNMRPLLAECLWKRAEACAALARHEDALVLAERALEVAVQIDSLPIQAEIYRVLARIERGSGRLEAAMAHVERMSAWVSTQVDPLTRARFDLERGLCLLALGDPVQAEAALAAAETTLRKVDAQRYLPHALAGLEQARGTTEVVTTRRALS